MREEGHGKVIRHDAVELAINCIGTQYPVQLGLYVGSCLGLWDTCPPHGQARRSATPRGQVSHKPKQVQNAALLRRVTGSLRIAEPVTCSARFESLPEFKTLLEVSSAQPRGQQTRAAVSPRTDQACWDAVGGTRLAFRRGSLKINRVRLPPAEQTCQVMNRCARFCRTCPSRAGIDSGHCQN